MLKRKARRTRDTVKKIGDQTYQVFGGNGNEILRPIQPCVPASDPTRIVGACSLPQRYLHQRFDHRNHNHPDQILRTPKPMGRPSRRPMKIK